MADIAQQLREYRPINEWGDPVHHTICDEAALEIERLRAVLAPFIAMRDGLTVKENVKLISKKLDGMTPITVTVTKAQFLTALSAKGEKNG